MGVLGAQPPRKTLVTTPSRLPENEENASFKTDYLKKMLCQGYAKKYYESKRLFLCYALQVWFTPGRCSHLSSRQSRWERTSQNAKKIEYERQPHYPTTLFPRVKTKHGFLAKPVVKGTQEVHSSRGVRGHAAPGKFLKLSWLIALVAILRL